MISKSGIRATDAIYEAFARGDIEAVLAQLDPAVEWRLAEGHPYSPDGEPWVGHEALVESFFARVCADWDPFAVTVTSVHDAGDSVVAEVRYTGTFKPTGRSLDAQGCHVWKVRDGKVTSFQQYLDTGRVQAVMGSALLYRP